MSRDAQTLFLARRAYRLRRMMDAARLLPLFGAVLLCLPMLWVIDDTRSVPTTYVMSFLFLSWLGMIGLAAFISSRLPDAPEDIEPSQSDDTRGT